jgi:hypothetical protein
MSIKCLRLINGEEVLAHVVEEKDCVVLQQPAVLVLSPKEEGKMMVVPWLPLAKKLECKIKTDHIVTMYDPQEGLANHYRQQTGGIVTAGAGILSNLPEKPF